MQLPAAPDLEDADRPAVSVALGRGDAIGGETERIVDVVQNGAGLAAPLLGESLARPGQAVYGARTRAFSRRNPSRSPPFPPLR
jgi:hypothetical protein